MLDFRTLNNQLVEAIKLENGVQDEAILEAFRRVPRHEFVPSFYDRIRPDERKWRLVSFSANEDEWLDKVYSNRPLTVSLGAEDFPNSSSSHPGVMARMLQSLQLQPRMRVLEIGTGTGYNAALLAQIVGNNFVTSLDINQEFIDLASDRIERTVGPGVTLLCADGRNLPYHLCDYDAIIVTASHDRIEPSWLNALALDGRIIFNYSASLIKLMLEARRSSSCSLSGRVCDFGGDFMALHDGTGVMHKTPDFKRLSLLIPGLDFRSHLENLDFRFFLYRNVQSLNFLRFRTNGEPSYALLDTNNVRRIHCFADHVSGDPSLFDEVRSIQQRFELLDSPRRSEFSLSISEDGVMAFELEHRNFRL